MNNTQNGHGSRRQTAAVTPADVDSQQETSVLSQRGKSGQTEETVEHDFIYRYGENGWFCRQGVAYHIADGSNALVTRIGNVQRRIVHLITQTGEGGIQMLRRFTGVGAAVDIAFQRLEAQPATLFQRDVRKASLLPVNLLR